MKQNESERLLLRLRKDQRLRKVAAVIALIFCVGSIGCFACGANQMKVAFKWQLFPDSDKRSKLPEVRQAQAAYDNSIVNMSGILLWSSLGVFLGTVGSICIGASLLKDPKEEILEFLMETTENRQQESPPTGSET
jgi:hypothetical protein